MSKRALFAFVLGAFSSVSTAEAATFDFVAAAAGNEHGAVSEAFNSGGLTVTATARSLDGTLTYLMYLDDLSDGPGGLGVCKNAPGGGECSPDNDDNIGYLEVLTLTFSQPVFLNQIDFSNGDHKDIYAGSWGLAIDSNPTSVAGFTLYPGTASFVGGLFGTTFSFISDASVSGILGDHARELYISVVSAEPVPEPATLILLGLGGFAAICRRRLSA